MRNQIKNVINYLKQQDIDGCITGSCLLDYFEGQDVDLFCYSEKSFTKIFYTLYHNPMFNILDKLEEWKANMFMNNADFNNTKHTSGIQTIKFTYNTCIPVNIIYKKHCNNIFAVLSSFDLNVISKGYDLKTKEYLDLTNSSVVTKIVSWNKWNPMYYSTEIWTIGRILRQLERCFKYHKRGYNTDLVIQKYIELINGLLQYQNIFSSENFSEKLKITQKNTEIIKSICEVWLQTHTITEEQIELLKLKIREL
jgi:hypothetical protein